MAMAASYAVLARLGTDHDCFRRLLGLLDALQATPEPTGQRPTYSSQPSLTEIAAFVRDYPDAVHHRLEMELFETLVNKGLKPAEQALINRNLVENSQILKVTDDAVEVLASLAAEPGNAAHVAPRLSKLSSEALQSYVQLQRQHMEREENQLFPLALSLLSDADWARIDSLGSALALDTDQGLSARHRPLLAWLRRQDDTKPSAP